MDIDGIRHLTFSTKGGAGGVASELSRGISLTGTKSVIVSTTTGAIPDLKFRKPVLVSTALFDFFIVRSKDCNQLFTLFRRFLKINLFAHKPRVSEILHLHWTPGIISTSAITKNLKTGCRIVWTLHDMWAFTGGCHFSDKCDQFKIGCNSCPQVKPIFQSAVHNSFKRKLESLHNSKNLKIVTPSHWLKSQAQMSKIMMGKDISVIPNPIDCDFFKPNSKVEVEESTFVIGCSAANLMENRKGIALLVEWIDEYVSLFPDRKLSILAIGSGQLTSELVEIRKAGFVSDKKQLRDLYNQMDIFVSLATAENLPLNVGEAVASGLPTICRDSGGLPELVDHGKTGFIISAKEEFLDHLSTLMLDRDTRIKMGENARLKALSEFDTSVVVRQYLELYASI